LENGEKMNHKTILLVEDNADDEVMTLRALKQNDIMNEVFVARGCGLKISLRKLI